MAKAKKPTLPTLVFPDGRFKWPKLNKPDYGTKKYPNPDGEFSTKVVYQKDSPEFVRLMKTMQPHFDEALAKAEKEFASLPVKTRKEIGQVKPKGWFSEVYDEDTEEPTGEVEIKVKTKAKYKDKEGKVHARIIPIFDASGKPMTNPPEIWGGTTGAVNAAIAPYFVNSSGEAGLTFYLNSVQIIDLVTSGGTRSADAYGFAKRNGGYSYDESDAADDTSEDDTTENDDQDPPFDTDEEAGEGADF